MASDDWELPKPIFRTSEGTVASTSTPTEHTDFVEPDTLSPDSEENLSSLYLPPEPSPNREPQPGAAVMIEEQPFVSEQVTADRIVPVLPENAVPPKKQGSSFTTILLLLLLVLVALFAVLYYVFFIRQPADTTF